MWILPVPALYAFACRAALCAATSFWANTLMMNMKLVHSETCSDQSIHIAQTRPKLQFKQIASSDLDKPDILWPPHAMRGTACSGCIMFSPCPSCCLSWCLSRAGVYPDFLTGGNLRSLRGGRVRAEDLNLSTILMYIVSMISSIWSTDNHLTNRKIFFLQV